MSQKDEDVSVKRASHWKTEMSHTVFLGTFSIYCSVALLTFAFSSRKNKKKVWTKFILLKPSPAAADVAVLVLHRTLLNKISLRPSALLPLTLIVHRVDSKEAESFTCLFLPPAFTGWQPCALALLLIWFYCLKTIIHVTHKHLQVNSGSGAQEPTSETKQSN